MKVLLTSHQGYLGTVMAPVLQAAGYEVTGPDVDWLADCVFGPVPTDPPDLRVDPRGVIAADLEGFDAVIHLAALSNDPLGHLASEIIYDISHVISVRLARLVKQAGVDRLLYPPIHSVYGAAGDRLVAEDADLAPVTLYAISKVRVEKDFDEFTNTDFCTVLLRSVTAFGFSPRLRADIVLNNLVEYALLTGQVLVLSGGTPWRPLMHTADITEVLAAALTAPADEVRGEKTNVGTEANNVTVAEIAEVVAAETGAAVWITGEAGNDPCSYRADFPRLCRLLPDANVRHSITDGARELVAAYHGHGMTEDLFTHRFTRFARIRELQESPRIDVGLQVMP